MFEVTVGVDWGTEKHAVHVIEHWDGGKRRAWSIQHTAEGIDSLVRALRNYGHKRLAVAVERPDGLLVEGLQEAGFELFHINPKKLDRFRDRFSVAGAKDDPIDARVLASALFTDTHCFDLVPVLDDWQLELRRLTRLEQRLTRLMVAVGNRLQACLSLYFPQMLEVSTGFTRTDWILDLVEAVPCPDTAERVSEEELRHVLRRTPKQPADVLRTLRLGRFHVSRGVLEASRLEAVMLVRQLRLLRQQNHDCLRRMKAIVDQVEAAAEETSRSEWVCDIAVLRSLPGIGDKNLPGLLVEAPQLLRDRDYRRLRVLAGVAPVTRRTGKMRPQVRIRRGCSSRLRQIVHQIANNALREPRFRNLYARQRARGHSHARALRTVGDRFLAVMMACLRDQTLFEKDRRTAA